MWETQNNMTDKKISLSPLPYDYSDLEPVISRKIMELHHDKHHAAYVAGANSALERLSRYEQNGEELNVREALRDYSFNYNGAMLHDIFWTNMRSPIDNNQPDQKIESRLVDNFGSVEAFKREFSAAGLGVEGSGWAVLWQIGVNNLMIGQLEKHNLLGLNGAKPVLVLDVWEHGYYLDYENNRAKYIEEWWKVVNWTDVEKRLQQG